MDSYTGFAGVYDLFMDNIPYDEWCSFIVSHLRKYGIDGGIAADLGCGTGQMTRRLRDAGFDMIGVDASPEMLDEAMHYEDEAARGDDTDSLQEQAAGTDILYLCQDMREMEFYGTVRAFVSVCDTMNYISTPEDMLTVLRLVNNYLDPGGIFLFDINTDLFYENIGDSTIAENREEAAFIWENDYDADTRENIYQMTFFTKEEDGRYRKLTEEHVQRAWSLSELNMLIQEAGLRFEEALDADTHLPPDDNTERLYIVAKEIQKSGKGETPC